MLSRGLAILTVLVWVLVAAVTPSFADDGFALRRFEMAPGQGSILGVPWADTPAGFSWTASTWLESVDDPLVVYLDPDNSHERAGALVARRHLIGASGAISFGGRYEIGAELPVVVYQNSDADAEQLAMSGPLGSGGLGDLRLTPKIQLLSMPVGLAIRTAVSVPLGGARDYLREAAPMLVPEVVVSHRWERYRVSGSVGQRIRQNARIQDLFVGDELFLRVGGAMAVGKKIELLLNASIATAARSPFSKRNNNAFDSLVGVSYLMSDHIAIFAGTGLGVGGGYGVADWTALGGARLTPTPHRHAPPIDPDPDLDGLLGKADSCPAESEDIDGFEDDDGCPELDNDQDGTADPEDDCPLVAGKPEFRGCPAWRSMQLHIRVLTEESIGVLGALVRVDVGAEAIKDASGGQLTTDPSGNVKATIEQDGVHVIEVLAKGFSKATMEVTPTSGRDSEVVVVLKRGLPPGEIRGMVTDLEGEPVLATVQIGETGTTLKTGPDGAFRLEILPGRYRVDVEARGYASQARWVEVDELGVVVLNVTLRKR